jgi:hypothetical protein
MTNANSALMLITHESVTLSSNNMIATRTGAYDRNSYGVLCCNWSNIVMTRSYSMRIISSTYSWILIGVSSSLLFDREKADNYGSNGWFLNPHDCTLYAKKDNIWKQAYYNKKIVKNDVIQVRLTDDGPHQSHYHVSYSINVVMIVV